MAETVEARTPKGLARSLVRSLAQDPSQRKVWPDVLRGGCSQRFMVAGVNGVAYEVAVREIELSAKEQLLSRLQAGAMTDDDKASIEKLLGHVSDDLWSAATDHRGLHDPV